MFQKKKRYINKAYVEYIKQQPCCVSRVVGVDPHHTKSVGSGGSDLTCIPLSHKLHQEGHQIGWDTFQVKYNIDFRDVRIELLERWVEEESG